MLKGNFWAGHNPATPYTNFIYNMSGATGGPYKDNYPQPDDKLSKQPSIKILYPTAGTYASIGSQKTIEWRSAGCTYVDVYYQAPATGLVKILTDYPDVGIYRWTVPNLPPASNYTIYIDCKNSTNALVGVNATSGAFTIAKAGLELLTPQGNERLTSGGTAFVAWKRGAGVTAVDVLYRTDNGGFSTVLAANVTRDAVAVTVPGTITSRGSFLVRASNDSAIADSTDGYVNARGGAQQVIAPTGTLQVGTLEQVEWTSPANSQYVDVSYVNTATGSYVPLIQNLPDFGRFTFLVPEQTMNGTRLRVQFKSSAAAVISTLDSGTFDTAVIGGPPSPPPAPPAGTPEVVDFSALNGSATEGIFTATYSHPSGVSGHYLGYMLFLPTPNVVNYVATGSCLVEYNRISNGMRLIDDPGTGWLGPLIGVPAGPGGGILSNSYCTLDTTQSGARFSGNTMYVDAKVTFKSSLSRVLGTFLQELDVNGVWTGMTQFGNWTPYPVASPKPGPYIVAGSPQIGAGSSTAITITAGHTSGTSALTAIHLLISSKIVGGSPCHIAFVPAGNAVVLVNDGGTGVVPGSVTPGTSSSLSNSRCTVSGIGMNSSGTGNTVTITIPVSFNTSTFGGAKTLYLNAFDNTGLLTHWQQFGAWTVQ